MTRAEEQRLLEVADSVNPNVVPPSIVALVRGLAEALRDRMLGPSLQELRDIARAETLVKAGPDRGVTAEEWMEHAKKARASGADPVEAFRTQRRVIVTPAPEKG